MCDGQTIRVASNARQQGSVGRVMVVLLTDGRANVSLAKSNDDPDAANEKPSAVSSRCWALSRPSSHQTGGATLRCPCLGSLSDRGSGRKSSVSVAHSAM